jgi:hypothetical protein
VTRLVEQEWRARQAAHEARVDAWTGPVLDRARRHEAHPVEDFLFTYYSQRPGRLRRWSPGPGVALEGWPVAEPWVPARSGAAVLGPPPEQVVARATRTVALLEATASRAPRFGCFGLHEWAMVYRQEQQDVRHSQLPLRLGPAGTADVVESLPLQCSHFDAFRFFTGPARPRNAVPLSRDVQLEHEQGGCLHANMDLYREAHRLSPWVAAELVADCFDLARRVRVLDMRASPYDVSSLGLSAVAVETEQGRQEYAAAQRAFAIEAAPLRDRVLAAARLLLEGLAPGGR